LPCRIGKSAWRLHGFTQCAFPPFTSTTGTVVAQSGGGFAVDGEHTYADEGNYTVSTTIKDVGGSTASASGTASVADAALSVVSVGGQPQTLFQSVPDLFSTPPNSDFVDDVAGNQQMFDTFTLGNDSSVTSITFDVSNLAQFFPNWSSEPLTLAIYNIAPGGGPGTKLFSATFTPDADAHINFNLSFATALVNYDAHLALNPGTYLITYYNQDGLGAMGFVNGGSDQAFAEHLSTGTISQVGESLGFSLNGEVIAAGPTVSGTEGKAINGATVATFTDANPNATASDFNATIDWGDGTSTSGTVVAQSGGSFAVDGTHTYAEEGKYAVGVTINDIGGSTTSATSNANIADAPLTATGLSITGTEGITTGTVTVATFTDANPNATASDFKATINWGDGTSTAGTIVAQTGGGFAVDGSHSYANDGRYTIGISVDDIGGSSASATSTADVSAPQVALTINPVDGNNVINHGEAHTAGGISITGKETGLSSGATFVVSVVDGSFSKDYTATAKANGSWDATIPSADAVTLPNGTATITAQADSVKVSEKVTVDETLPTVLLVIASPSKGDLGAGKVVTLTVDFSEKVTVSGHPELKLNDGGVAGYVTGSGTSSLKFSYTVAGGQNTADLTVTGLTLAGGATIKDAAGNNAVLTGAVTNPAGVLQIDTKAPTVESVTTSGAGITAGNGDLDAGKLVVLTVDFSEKVTVTGTPALKLNDGGAAG
jgi:hypothetical protein